MRAEPPTRRRGVDAPSRPQRGVFERLFPSMFSLWRVVRRVRPSSPRADQPTRLTPRRFQGRPAQAALENAPGPAPAPVEELVLEAAPPLAAGPQGRPVVESQPSTPQADSLPPGYQEPPPSRAEIRLTQSPPSRLQADRATSQRQAPAPTPPRVDHSTTQRTPPGQERSEGPVDARGTPTADRTEPGQPSRPPDVESEGSRAELEENSERAREEIKTTQAVRREAASERRRAQRALDESDGFQRETARVMAHARVSFAKAVALNPGALKNMGSNIKALEEAIKTEGHLRRLTRQQAEQEADGARQRAIQSILTALAAVRKASDQAGRELEESRRIAAMAESHRDSSETDLNRGRTIKAEAESQIRQEASRLLREPSGGDIGFPEESLTLIDLGLDAFPEETFSSKLAEAPQLPISPAVERPVEGVWPTVEERHPPPSQYERAIDPPAPGITEPVQEQAVPREHTPVGQDRAEMASTHNLESALNDFLAAIEMGAAPGDEAIPEPPAVNSEGLFLDNLDFSRARSEAAQPPRSFDAGDGHATNGEVVRRPPPSSQPQASQPQASQPQASQPQASQPQAPQPQAPQRQAPQPRGGASEVEFGDELLGPLRDALAAAKPEVDSEGVAPPGSSLDPTIAGSQAGPERGPAFQESSAPQPQPRLPEPSQPAPPEDTHTGILRIVFTPAADEATVQFFWDVLENVTGVGVVIDRTFLPDSSGLELTLDLGDGALVTRQLAARIPGAEIGSLGPDRLQVRLSPMGD